MESTFNAMMDRIKELKILAICSLNSGTADRAAVLSDSDTSPLFPELYEKSVCYDRCPEVYADAGNDIDSVRIFKGGF